MYTFAEKPKETHKPTSAKSSIPDRTHFGQVHEMNTNQFHLQPVIGNDAVPQLLQLNSEDGKRVTTRKIDHFGHNFCRIPLFHLSNAANFSTESNNLTHREKTDDGQYRHPLDRIEEKQNKNPIHASLGKNSALVSQRIMASNKTKSTSPIIEHSKPSTQHISRALEHEGRNEEGQDFNIQSRISYRHEVHTPEEEPSDCFGITEPKLVFDSVNILFNNNTFIITGYWVVRITKKIRNNIGPRNQVNIDSEDSGNIDADNFVHVALDLLPFRDNIPPMKYYWARDLTILHENVHILQSKEYGQTSFLAINTFLSNQRARGSDDIQRLLNQAKIKGNVVFNKPIIASSSEREAYGAVADFYRKRSIEILMRGLGRRGPQQGYGEVDPDYGNKGFIILEACLAKQYDILENYYNDLFPTS